MKHESSLRIAIVGGLDRLHERYASLARARGYRFEHHTGDVSGRGIASLEALVRRADLVIIVTGVNSHAAVLHVRAMARKHDVASLICKSFGTARFATLLDAIAIRQTHHDAVNTSDLARSCACSS